MFANLWSQLVVLPLSGQKNKTKNNYCRFEKEDEERDIDCHLK